jgi:hypothetical protein
MRCHARGGLAREAGIGNQRRLRSTTLPAV